MLMIVVFLAIYFLRNTIGESYVYILGTVFVLASITDFFDGYLARKYNLVTTFGKFIDPLADKLLVISALFVLHEMYAQSGYVMYWMPFWVVLLIVVRELLVTSIRLVAVGDGLVIAASKLGKYKTFSTMTMIAYYFFIMPIHSTWVDNIGIFLVALSVMFTVVSGLDYLLKNKAIILKSI